MSTFKTNDEYTTGSEDDFYDSHNRQLKFYEKNEGGLASIDNKNIYYMGVIDVFTEFTAAKRAEFVWKSMTHEYGAASCVPP